MCQAFLFFTEEIPEFISGPGIRLICKVPFTGEGHDFIMGLMSRRWPILIPGLALLFLACNLFRPAAPDSTPAYFPGPLPGAAVTPAQPTAAVQTAVSTAQAPAPALTANAGQAAYQPRFEPGPCAFPFPDGYSPDCGYLVVPENRSRPEGPAIRLAVAVFRSTSPDPAPDPVVHLAGGPGSSSLDVAGYLFAQGMDLILERRDFILFDQRGTGYSIPRLDCPERQALVPALLDGSLSEAEAARAVEEAFLRCRDRLVGEGNDLSAYNSAASAADLNDLRLALGYEQLNLYGVSYGTRLALTALRDYPQAVRSAVLDSVYPLEVNLYTSLAPNAQRAFTVFFSRCAASPECSTAYGDLERLFYDLVDRLNQEPMPVSLSLGGVEQRVLLDGGLLIDVLFGGLYNPAVTARMPEMIFDLSRGDTALLRQRLALYFDPSVALGMQMAVQCAEELPFNQAEEAFAAAAEVRPPIAAFFPASVQPFFAACREWGTASPDPRENQPVASSIPVLILAGEFDPITPPDWGRQTAAVLENSYFVELPYNGHWVTRSSACAREMALTFWENPATPPDAGCVQDEPALQFAR